MTRGKSDLEWTNIGRADLGAIEHEMAWDAFMQAKANLESVLGDAAVCAGAAEQGDVFKFSYARIGQGTIGMAIGKPEVVSQGSGFGGLRRPKPKQDLASWARDRDAAGYRR